MKVLVTGANGFIGTRLVELLLAPPGLDVRQLSVLDREFARVPDDSRVRTVVGDLTHARVLAEALQSEPDLIFHLASIPGGLAEREFELGLDVNLRASVELLEAVRRQGRRPRLVFASSVAVYGVPMPSLIDENTPAAPSISYGAHKRIVELLISDYSRRGLLDGCSLRLPGVVARPSRPSGLVSAFMSDALRELAAGRPFEFPVAGNGAAWWMSRECVVRNLLRAGRLDAHDLQSQRVWLLPVLHASMLQVVDAIADVYGEAVRRNASFAPNAQIQAQFASFPPQRCPSSIEAGFQHDGTLRELVQRALA